MVPAWHLVLDAYRIIGTLNDTLNSYLNKHSNELSRVRCVGDETLLRSLHEQLFMGERQPMADFKLLLKSFDMTFTLGEIQEMTDERIAEALRQKKIAANVEILGYLNDNSTELNADEYLIQHFDEFMEDGTLDLDNYMRNSMCVHVLESRLTLNQKKYFLDNYVVITKGKSDSRDLAKLVCFYYDLCGVHGADKELVTDAITVYQGTESWESKIKLINKCNEVWTYDLERENKLLDGLGDEYHKLTYARGWASFDINEHNKTLLDYLKGQGHYISRVEEKEGQYYVTFKHS